MADHPERRAARTAVAEKILTLLRRQSVLYGELEALAARQRGLITTQDGAEPLLRVLGERQKVTGELVEIARRLEPVRQNWREYRMHLHEEARSEAQRLLDEAHERLSRVMNSDEQDARLLQAHKSRTMAVLGTVPPQRTAIKAYGAG